MINLSLLFAGLLLMTSQKAKNPSEPQHNYCETPNHSWQGGEEVTYKLYYQLNFLWIAAGEVSFKVKDLGDRYKISIEGKTINAFEWFYKVNDHYESVIDKMTLLPISFSRDIHEGKYEWWDKFYFDQKYHEVQVSKGGPGKETKYNQAHLSDCMHDMISIIYNIRNTNFDKLKVGDQFDIRVFVEEEYLLKVEIGAKNLQTRIRGLGKHDAHLIRPQVVAGHFFRKEAQMDVYMSADRNRLPLMIESPVSVGKVKAILKEYKGLKYPLTSID